MFGPSVLPGNIPLGLTGGAPITSLPGLPDGLALDRLSSLGGTQSLAGLAAPSSLNGLLEQQLAQSGQLLQLMTLLLSLMQNKTTGQTGSAGDSSAANGAAPVNSATSQAAGAEVAKAGSGNVSTVQRQGKPIGAHISKQFDDMVAAAKKDGINITITSGARSRAEQEKLYAAYKNGTGNLAAKPGTSNHESGDALDLGPPSAYAWLKQNAGQFGFKNKIASEPWHWSLTGN